MMRAREDNLDKSAVLIKISSLAFSAQSKRPI